MKKRKINLEFTVYDQLSELSTADQNLVKSARKALDLSYSPYSNFKVGAAALLEDGTIVSGANQENASYPLCLCAERSVLAITANSHKGKKVMSMAVVVHNPNQDLQEPCSPCGACRQVLSESEDQQKAPIRLILTAQNDLSWILESAKDLLPLAFSGEFLED